VIGRIVVMFVALLPPLLYWGRQRAVWRSPDRFFLARRAMKRAVTRARIITWVSGGPPARLTTRPEHRRRPAHL
jgi:hypothetical protein